MGERQSGNRVRRLKASLLCCTCLSCTTDPERPAACSCGQFVTLGDHHPALLNSSNCLFAIVGAPMPPCTLKMYRNKVPVEPPLLRWPFRILAIWLCLFALAFLICAWHLPCADRVWPCAPANVPGDPPCSTAPGAVAPRVHDTYGLPCAAPTWLQGAAARLLDAQAQPG